MISPRDIRFLLIRLAGIKEFAPGDALCERVAQVVEEFQTAFGALVVANRKNLLKGSPFDLIEALAQVRAHLGFLDDIAAELKREKEKKNKALTPLLRELLEGKTRQAKALLEEESRKAKEEKNPGSDGPDGSWGVKLKGRRRRRITKAESEDLANEMEDEGGPS